MALRIPVAVRHGEVYKVVLDGEVVEATSQAEVELRIQDWLSEPRPIGYLRKALPKSESGQLVSRMSVARWMVRGVSGVRLPHTRVGQRLYATLADLQKWLDDVTSASLPADEPATEPLGVSDSELAEVGLQSV